jgi:hypothetical protein
MRKRFDEYVEELTRLADTQTAADLAAMSATRRVYGLTQALINHHMTHVARIAAVELPPGPELATLAMPKSTITGERLASKARGMATQAAKCESTFIAAGSLRTSSSSWVTPPIRFRRR